MTTITNFTEAFPHKELTPLPPNTKSTHAYLKGLKRQVYANLQAIPSNKVIPLASESQETTSDSTAPKAQG